MTSKKTFQIVSHIMPWEIDYCLILFDTLARARELTTQRYRIDVALNLSNYHIDWSESKLDKEYFSEKMEYYSKLLSRFDEVNVTVYDGDDNYGHLDLQKNVVRPDNDYYIGITPDQLFDKSVLSLMEQSVESIQEKYFVLVAEIPRLWDTSWDIISNHRFDNTPRNDDGSYNFLAIDRYEALSTIDKYPVQLQRVNGVKYAGWFDLYNKAFYEELAPVPADWTGYGQWDLYSMLMVSNIYRTKYPLDFAQYKLTNAVTTSIEYSNWEYGKNREIYHKRLAVKKTENQREYYDAHMSEYLAHQLNNFMRTSK
jgi:hypothetical protein